MRRAECICLYDELCDVYILYVYTVLSYSCAVVVLCCSRGGLWKWGIYTTNIFWNERG